MPPPKETMLIFEDCETTGLVPGVDEVIEVASLLTDLNMKEVSRFHEKIKFDTSKMTKGAAEKNHYDPKEWAFDAVPFYEYSHWLEKNIPFGSVATPIGHNPKFDRDIIWEGYYKPTNAFFKWGYRVVDTAAIAMGFRVAGIIQVENVKLATVADALDIDQGQSHTAWDDMLTSKAIFEKFVELVKKGHGAR